MTRLINTAPKQSPCRGLAIETSGQSGSVALVENARVLVEESFPHGLKHAAGMLPMIDRLIRQHDWEPSDVGQLFISHGPGSFTGLRIGITLAKTLSMVTGAKIVPVPTLQILAQNAPVDARNLIVLLDAKRDQIFTARYEWQDGKWIEKEQAHLDSLTEMLNRAPRPVHLLGEGIPFHEKFLPTDRDGIIVTDQSTWRARASVVAQLGAELAAAGIVADADRFTPMYVRKPEAEEKYEEQKNAGK
jgi:tRNA threonylcarbamoyladenosine biosynthesis protein TsaB